jgi:hypothetical protein
LRGNNPQDLDVRIGSKADIGVRPRNVRFTPHLRTAKASLFDYLVCWRRRVEGTRAVFLD